MAEYSVRDNRFAVDARQKGLEVVGLSPFCIRAVVLGSQWEQDVEFWRILFLAIVRSEQNTERLGLLIGAATSRVRASINANMAGIN